MKTLEDRNEELFNKIVSASGKCETLEGESLRAINRIIYRYRNDGDYWFDGYGVETAGPAESFLREFSPIDIRAELDASECTEGEDYERRLLAALEKLVSYIEGRNKQYSRNYHDMHDCEPRCEKTPNYDY